MSDLMYDEVPGYKAGNWKSYAIHDDSCIKGFFGDYRWLSNFHLAEVCYDGDFFVSSENAYQAAKVENDYREEYKKISPADSKYLNRRHVKDIAPMLYAPQEWDGYKYDCMAQIVFDKFARNMYLRKMLVQTGDKYLEETNHWKDTGFGVDCQTGQGQNMLGLILMNIRKFWQNYNKSLARLSVNGVYDNSVFNNELYKP